jgi:ribosomal protein S18 acetylase RimI-like enzyme
MYYQKITDINELIELGNNELKEENPSREAYESHFTKTDISYGCYIKQKLIAFVFAIKYTSFIYIMTIAIDDEYHKKGIASKLIQYIIENNYNTLPIWLIIHKDNFASKKLFHKFFFKQELKKYIPKELKKNYRTHYYPYKLEYKYNLHDYDLYKEINIFKNKNKY